ncbi:MAG TPA: fumarylacetoacetate hydrolase family protein [Chloroflexota bacterium]|nr:fumarylacetoacetate hydrolase family protein [Chloroflexota bacterium]
MSLSEQQRQEAADRLAEAERTHTPIDRLTDLYPDIDVADAYDVQLRQVAAKKAAGATVVGKKIGLTGKAIQEQFGVSTPDYGHLMDYFPIPDGGEMRCAELIQPRVEPEIAFVLDKPLKGPGVNIAQVLAATRYVTPAFEIIDSRIKEWKFKYQDTVADNGSSARYVLGSEQRPVDQVDLRLVGMVFKKNGEDIGYSCGAAALGNPAAAVAWLANALAEYGIGLEAGEVILPGALTKSFDAEPGDTFSASYDGMGSVNVRFV